MCLRLLLRFRKKRHRSAVTDEITLNSESGGEGSVDSGTVYLVILEFPVVNRDDGNIDWLQSRRSEVERFCDEHCFKIGALHILPKLYFPFVESFIRKARGEYKKRGFDPTFKFLQVNLQGTDYIDLQRLIIDRTRSRLETSLSKLESEELSNDLLSDAMKEVRKASELMLIFQLSKAFPSDATRVYDLMGILKEKLSEFELHKSKEVVVTEL